ncbi:hypothetical protein [Trichloromonas sp.]|uniref:hypothetical protein n=1 Tax=Trichloromonas sp. TaxID=3069249 RepID=UPI002A483DBC|nr:hypothetical protein [Trichloromonas sp.]
MAKIKRFNDIDNLISKEKDAISKGIKSNNLWVVLTNYSTDIGTVFINKSDAEKLAEIQNKLYYDYYRKINKNMSDEEFDNYFKNNDYHKVKVISLEDAIEHINDIIREDSIQHDSSF